MIAASLKSLEPLIVKDQQNHNIITVHFETVCKYKTPILSVNN